MTAALQAVPLPGVDGSDPPAGGDGVVTQRKKKRSKKKKSSGTAMDGAGSGAEAIPATDGVDMVDVVSSSSTLRPAAAEFVPGGGVRVLQARPSRERSPRGTSTAPPSAVDSSSIQRGSDPGSTGTGIFTVGQAVVLVDLVSRADLVGKRGVVKSFDATSQRYAVRIDVTGDNVKVLAANLQQSIFVAGGGIG